MKQKNLFPPKVAFRIAIAILFVLGLALIFRRPLAINILFEKALIKTLKQKDFQFPERKNIQSYIDSLKNREIFALKSKRAPEVVSEEKDPLASLSFNGIIVLDKKYVAIFSEEDEKQYLISEGQSIKGIKIEKINQDSVIINVNNEEKEITF